MIDDIKDIYKLRQMLKSALQENRYLKRTCREVGERLAVVSYPYDGKERTLILQAGEAVEKINSLSNYLKDIEKNLKEYIQSLEEIEKYTIEQFCDNCEDIGSTELTCHCEYCEYGEILDIINKAKGGK